MGKKETRQDKYNHYQRWLKVALANADASMVPQKPQIRSASKMFHIFGEEEIFFQLKKAREKAEELGVNVITVSTLEEGIEKSLDYYYAFDGEFWAKYRGKEKISGNLT